jgi:hypothetical protein
MFSTSDDDTTFVMMVRIMKNIMKKWNMHIRTCDTQKTQPPNAAKNREEKRACVYKEINFK